jgi:hypothetical protein
LIKTPTRLSKVINELRREKSLRADRCKITSVRRAPDLSEYKEQKPIHILRAMRRGWLYGRGFQPELQRIQGHIRTGNAMSFRDLIWSVIISTFLWVLVILAIVCHCSEPRMIEEYAWQVRVDTLWRPTLASETRALDSLRSVINERLKKYDKK